MSSWFVQPSDPADSPVSAVPVPLVDPPAKPRPRAENKPSKLLRDDQNASIYELLGRDKLTLSTAVVQLALPSDDPQPYWKTIERGIACFVRHQTLKSYFIEVYSLEKMTMVFQQAIYQQFTYQIPQPSFLTFEGYNSLVGLNFSDQEEADAFQLALDKLDRKRKRRSERNRLSNLEKVNSLDHITFKDLPSVFKQTTSAPSASCCDVINRNKSTIKDIKHKERKTTPKVLKCEITSPFHFKHMETIRLNADNNGFDIDIKDPILVAFFEKAGVKIDGADVDTQKFIQGFIKENGGMKAVEKDLQNRSSSATDQASGTSKRVPSPREPPPKVPTKSKPKPPVPPRPSDLVISKKSPSSSTSGPHNCPVPPPPLPSPPIESGGVTTGDQSDLLRQIQVGVNLRPVDTISTKAVDEKSNLLGEIQNFPFASLKPIPPKDKTLKPSGLAETLLLVLERRQWIKDDSDSETNDSDSEEWPNALPNLTSLLQNLEIEATSTGIIPN